MALTKSLTFGSVFLYREICPRVVSNPPAKTLVAFSLGFPNTAIRTYSKCMPQLFGKNGLVKIYRGEGKIANILKVKAGQSSVFAFTENRSVVITQSLTRMLSTVGSSPNPAGPGLSENSPKKSEDAVSSGKVEQEAKSATNVQPKPELSRKEKLKQAVRDYGATVLVFHVTMSLMSLGFFYLLVQSGLDVVSLLAKLGLSESITNSKVTEEAGKFVFAYAIHKVFAPLRITITLTATPLIVRKLRAMGILKQMAKKKPQ